MYAELLNKIQMLIRLLEGVNARNKLTQYDIIYERIECFQFVLYNNYFIYYYYNYIRSHASV